MANLQTPYGFRHTGYLVGHPANFGNSLVSIRAADATPIFFGDPITRLANGYIAKATANTQVHGIFIGCQYLSAVKGYTNYSMFWPGNGDALADAKAWVISTPDATFQIETGNSAAAATPALTAAVGLNIGFSLGTPGNLRTGLSGVYADLSTLGTSAALPFKVVSLVTDPPGGNGTDATTSFNDIIVTFNSTDYRAGTTGI